MALGRSTQWQLRQHNHFTWLPTCKQFREARRDAYTCMNYIAVSTMWTLTPPDNWDIEAAGIEAAMSPVQKDAQDVTREAADGNIDGNSGQACILRLMASTMSWMSWRRPWKHSRPVKVPDAVQCHYTALRSKCSTGTTQWPRLLKALIFAPCTCCTDCQRPISVS
jgi:hypothetical protein